mmetsp:Transcript_45282/g.113996  ORF Transcript_45282/g.113996 Transcript_45282/m.113996 type:complete len:330 (+) Transcript_45282:212-1201(+)
MIHSRKKMMQRMITKTDQHQHEVLHEESSITDSCDLKETPVSIVRCKFIALVPDLRMMVSSNQTDGRKHIRGDSVQTRKVEQRLLNAGQQKAEHSERRPEEQRFDAEGSLTAHQGNEFLERLDGSHHRVEQLGVNDGQETLYEVLVARQKDQERLEGRNLQIQDGVRILVVRERVRGAPVVRREAGQIEDVHSPVIGLVEEVVRADGVQRQKHPGQRRQQQLLRECAQQQECDEATQEELLKAPGASAQALGIVLPEDLVGTTTHRAVEAVLGEGERRLPGCAAGANAVLGEECARPRTNVVRLERLRDVVTAGFGDPATATRVFRCKF